MKIKSSCPYSDCDWSEVIETDDGVDETPRDCPKCGRLIKNNKNILKIFYGVEDVNPKDTRT